ncbi:putative ankyrin repeat protein RF_0381 [Physella acuta]|uniref:putative ankyrin repeat protein RF_0381 n=1 Tax=Physella acuta TaxID=109671 RepID=UPI0027DBF806|nr:putative ankyrin repeat protein RF_0381 [Physella acuta]
MANLIKDDEPTRADRDISGDTDLHIAVKNNNPETVHHLIQCGRNVNEKNNNGDTPISLASNLTIAQYLINAKSDINLRNNLGETSLHCAVRCEHEDVVRLLVDNGAEIDSKNNSGETTLMYAIQAQNLTLVQYLVDQGANVNIQDCYGRNALMHAITCGSPYTSDVIVLQTVYDARFEENVCEYLIARGAEVNAKDVNGQTVCMLAVNKDPHRLLPKLVSLGADLNLLDNEKRSALVYRLMNKELQTIGFYGRILDLGADPVIHENYRHLVKEITFDRELCYYDSEMIWNNKTILIFQFLLMNGRVHDHACPEFFKRCCSSNISCAISKSNLNLVKFLFATGFLFRSDLVCLRPAKNSYDLADDLVGEFQSSTSVSPRDLQAAWLGLDSTIAPYLYFELRRAMREPWPLVKLAFIEVSTLLGTGPMREEKLKQTKLPPRLQRTLMFQEPISRLPVEDWSKIPLCFDPVQYETLPCPRPLLYYWPVGHRLVN